MSLLLQALGGALNAGATTASNMIQEDVKAQRQAEMDAAKSAREHAYQTERDKATALREENLAKLRASLTAQQADTEYNRGPSGMVSTETGAALTRDELKNNPDLAMTPEQYKKDQEGYRAQEIGAAVAPIADSFKWDAKDPQGSAVKYMQALRATGELSETEVAAEANRMMQAKMPKEKKYIATTIGVGNGEEQSILLDPATGEYKTIGKPTAKFKSSADLAGISREMTKGQAAVIMDKLLRRKATAPDDFTEDDELLLSVVRQKATGADPKPSVKDFQGSGETMPIPPRGQQPKGMIATAGKQPAAAKRPPLDQFWK